MIDYSRTLPSPSQRLPPPWPKVFQGCVRYDGSASTTCFFNTDTSLLKNIVVSSCRRIVHSLGTPWARAAGAAVMVRGGCDCAKGRLGRQHSDSRHLASRACSAQGPLMRHRPNAGGVPCAQRYRRRPASDMLGSPSCSGRGTPSASRKRVIRIRCRGWR